MDPSLYWDDELGVRDDKLGIRGDKLGIRDDKLGISYHSWASKRIN
jgi:hypothetical protein